MLLKDLVQGLEETLIFVGYLLLVYCKEPMELAMLPWLRVLQVLESKAENVLNVLLTF